jgi:hypothetical protein
MNGTGADTDSVLLTVGDAWLDGFPTVRQRSGDAARQVAALGLLPACRHVLAAGHRPAAGGLLPAARLCVACPAEGLRCRDCHNAHVEGDTDPHTETAEHTCDGCGAVVEVISPFVILLNLTPPHRLRVRGLDGRKRTIAAPVGVQGFGLCRRCRRRACP